MTCQLQGPAVTEREAEILAMLDRHMTNTQIAQSLYISVRTVESHVSSMLRKVGVADRRSLARSTATTESERNGTDQLDRPRCCSAGQNTCTDVAVAPLA